MFIQQLDLFRRKAKTRALGPEHLPVFLGGPSGQGVGNLVLMSGQPVGVPQEVVLHLLSCHEASHAKS